MSVNEKNSPDPQHRLSEMEGAQTVIMLARKSVVAPVTQGMPPTLGDMSTYTLRLPSLDHLPADLNLMILSQLVDGEMKTALEESKVLNWCRTARPLYPLKTPEAGNCLLHSLSMAMWCVPDTFLHKLLYVALIEGEHEGRLRERWQKEKTKRTNKVSLNDGFNTSEKDWDHEWQLILEAVNTTRSSNLNTNRESPKRLEEIHIFAMANILKRPIIVLGENTTDSEQGEKFGKTTGVYLPLMWSHRNCIKTPLLLAFHMCHFSPLVGIDDDNKDTTIKGEHCVPLVTADLVPISVHFLTTEEEKAGHTLIQEYMNISEVCLTSSTSINTILVAKLGALRMDEELDLISNCYMILQQRHTESENIVRCEDIEHRACNRNEEHKYTIAAACLDEGKGIADKLTDLNLHGLYDTPAKDYQKAVSYGELQEDICATVGCPYQTHSPFAGYCSKCLEIQTGPPQRGETNRHREARSNEGGLPTSLHNEPTGKDKGHHSSQHLSLPEIDKTIVIPADSSVTNLPCQVFGCDYRASVNTHPFCHEHATDHRNQKGSVCEQGLGIPCIEQGCSLYGLPNQGNMCSQHYAVIMTQSQKPKQGRMASQQKATNKSTTFPRHRCHNRNCDSAGNALYGGYCLDCFLCDCEDPEQKRDNHNMKGISGRGLRDGHNLAEVSSRRGATGSFLDEKRSTQQILHQQQQQKITTTQTNVVKSKKDIGMHRRETSVEITTGDPKCSDCYTRRYYDGTNSIVIEHIRCSRHAGGPHREGYQPVWSQHASRQPKHESTPILHENKAKGTHSSPLVPQCTLPGCSGIGADNNYAVCQQCYHEICRGRYRHGNQRHATTGSSLERKFQQSVHNRRNPYWCRNPDCDKYGDPHLEGCCSECYETQRDVGVGKEPGKKMEAVSAMRQHPTLASSIKPASAPRRLSDPGIGGRMPVVVNHQSHDEGYEKAISQIEVQSRQSVAQCKQPTCTNYGNSRCWGYCNTCFIKADHPDNY